jgi:Lambda phage tail tube protein, TTP
MSTSALSSQGVTIAVALGSPSDFTGGTIPNVSTINGPSGSATVIDASDLSSSAREKVMGLMDEGQVTLEMQYMPDNAVHEYLRLLRAGKTLGSFRITFTDGAPATTFTFTAYVTGFAVSVGVDQLVMVSVTLEITGSVTKA